MDYHKNIRRTLPERVRENSQMVWDKAYGFVVAFGDYGETV